MTLTGNTIYLDGDPDPLDVVSISPTELKLNTSNSGIIEFIPYP
jgi:hypothetical protein